MIRSMLAGVIAMTMTVAGALADDRARHAGWDDLLETYIAESPDGINRFDYGALKANGGDVAALDAYLAGFAQLDFTTLSRDEQFAAWSNIYNALTVKHIVGRYPVKSIRAGHIVGPWKKVTTVVDGEEISLDAIEHKVLRKMGDPRVHYAINCASYSCPNLRKDAWIAETLDSDLDDATRAYVNHPRGVSVRARGGLEVSEIYKWFRDDFGGSEDSVIAHLLAYAAPELESQIRANMDIKAYDYDWSLNDVK